MQPKLVNRDVWLDARKALLDEEKELTRARDRLAARRRKLPMMRVERAYRFDTERGPESLAELFKGKRQLAIYHFMFGTDWEEGCPSCSLWTDHLSGVDVHLAARDTALVFVSNAPLERLLSYRQRMGWQIDWVSAGGTTFSADYGVTFEGGNAGPAGGYNYGDDVPNGEMPGVSVFYRLDDDGIAHSYSTYARGLEPLNGAYHLLDMTPKGRDEDELPFTMVWVRRRDRYEDGG